MSKIDITYEAYMNNLSVENRKILSDLFTQAQAALPGHKVTMKYSFPLLDGAGKFGIAEREGNIVLYFNHDKLPAILAKYQKELRAFKTDKECLQYKNASDIPVAVVVKMIKEIFK